MYCSLILMLSKIKRQRKCLERQKIKRQRQKQGQGKREGEKQNKKHLEIHLSKTYALTPFFTLSREHGMHN